MPDENTPLIANGANGEESELHRIRREFESELAQEDESTTLFDLLVKRPTTTILALSLFALIVIATSFVSAVKSSELSDEFMRVPQVALESVELLRIQNDEIQVHTVTQLQLDYSQLGDSFTSQALQRVSAQLGHVNLTLDGPVRISMQPHPADSNGEASNGASNGEANDGPSEWKHLVSSEIHENVRLDLTPNGEAQAIDLTVGFSDVGRSDAIELAARYILQNKPIMLRAQGTAVVKKFGISLRLPFLVDREILIPTQTTDELSELSQVTVDANPRFGVDITALANASIVPFPIKANFPALNWRVKLPGCSAEDSEEVCTGTTLPFALHGEDGKVEIYFQSTVDHIPPRLTAPCRGNKAAKSPLDEFISRYLAGELTTFYIEGLQRPGEPRIVNELIGGVEIPYAVFGKSASEKLIQSIVIQEVRLANSFDPTPSVTDKARFNGKVLVDVVLPKFLVMHARTAVMATGARGTVQLFDDRKRHFGQIVTWDGNNEDKESSWLQTVSLASGDAYKITCFFDDLPLEITDRQVFSEISQSLLYKGHATINYDAVMDVRFDTVVGEIVTKSVRLKGVTDMQA